MAGTAKTVKGLIYRGPISFCPRESLSLTFDVRRIELNTRPDTIGTDNKEKESEEMNRAHREVKTNERKRKMEEERGTESTHK